MYESLFFYVCYIRRPSCTPLFNNWFLWNRKLTVVPKNTPVIPITESRIPRHTLVTCFFSIIFWVRE
jgi:hypothetical protein